MGESLAIPHQNHEPSPAERIQSAIALLGKGSKSVREMRTLIMGLEAAMQAMPEYVPGKDFKTTHHFGPGTYCREALIPKEMVVTGRIHKTGHLNMLVQGKLTVWTEEGMKTLTAPAVITSQPGIKRVGYTHEDSIWITIHSNPSDERDIQAVEARLFADTFTEAYLGSERTFSDAIRFLGFSPDEVQAISENIYDQAPFPLDQVGVYVGESPVHGKGLFASAVFKAGEFIAPARIKGRRTPAGRFSNHSGQPNAEVRMDGSGDAALFATTDIESGAEIFSDYYFNFTNSREGANLCQL